MVFQIYTDYWWDICSHFQEKEKFKFLLQFLKWKHTLGYRVVFTQVSKSNWFALLLYTIGLKTSRHLFILSEVKPKQTETLSHSFSYVSHQLRVITSSFDWFIGFIQLQVQPKLIILLWLVSTCFPALRVSYMLLLRVLIGSLDCLCPLWLARVEITLFLVLRHSLKTAITHTQILLLGFRLNSRIPVHLFASHWIRKATIVRVFLIKINVSHKMMLL